MRKKTGRWREGLVEFAGHLGRQSTPEFMGMVMAMVMVMVMVGSSWCFCVDFQQLFSEEQLGD
jgi:hypothetical protein